MPNDKPHKIGWANRVTIARLLLIGPFVICLLNQNEPGSPFRLWALIVFAVMAFSDFLDGFLARRFHDESPLGAFLDPLADKVLVTFAIVILCVMGVTDYVFEPTRILRLPTWVVVAALGKDLIVCCGFFVVYLSTNTVLIRPRRLGKWCTTLELLLVLAMLLWPVLPIWLNRLPQVLWSGAAALAVLAAIDYIRDGNRYIITTLAARR